MDFFLPLWFFSIGVISASSLRVDTLIAGMVYEFLIIIDLEVMAGVTPYYCPFEVSIRETDRGGFRLLVGVACQAEL